MFIAFLLLLGILSEYCYIFPYQICYILILVHGPYIYCLSSYHSHISYFLSYFPVNQKSSKMQTQLEWGIYDSIRQIVVTLSKHIFNVSICFVKRTLQEFCEHLFADTMLHSTELCSHVFFMHLHMWIRCTYKRITVTYCQG